jgi:two-component system, chemotaxis family, protein-glutamate methylesterase/glutaminase
VVSDTLKKDSAFEVLGTASDGRIALLRIATLQPDVVVLDISMPVMGGLETLEIVKRDYPRVRVVMFSAATVRGATETIEALALGASDYVTKPTEAGSLELTIEAIQNDLIPKIKALFFRTTAVLPAPMPFAAGTAFPPNRRIDIVAIGTSTGVPNALAQ